MILVFSGEFPALSRVFVQERDLFLAHSLRIAVDSPVKFVPEQSTPHHMVTNEAPVVVGVVGIGHVSGIIANWDTVTTVCWNATCSSCNSFCTTLLRLGTGY